MSRATSNGVDCEETFVRLTRDLPKVAWPTVALFVSFLALFAAGITLGSLGLVPAWLAVLMGTVASYMSYSVVHEAAHASVSKNKQVNDWIGRIALLGVSITPFFANYRFVHLAHHRYTNDHTKDPDAFCGRGPAWTLPLRWNLMDVFYVLAYFRLGAYRAGSRLEKREFWYGASFSVAVMVALVALGWVKGALLFYFLPTRIGLFLLAFTFDFLPHYPHAVKVREDGFRSTANRVGMEWLLTPLLIGQNYHLSHHLYPSAPFYRYQGIWRARKTFHETNNAAAVRPFGLRPLPPKNPLAARPISSTDGGIEQS